jgi:hypothetical protein
VRAAPSERAYKLRTAGWARISMGKNRASHKVSDERRKTYGRSSLSYAWCTVDRDVREVENRLQTSSNTVVCADTRTMVEGLTLEEGSNSVVSAGLSAVINGGTSWSAESCTPVEIPVGSALGRLLRFPRFERTCLARHTVPREPEVVVPFVFVTGLYGCGSGWCFPSTSGSEDAAKGGGSSGVTGPEDSGELVLLSGSLGESSGKVTPRRFSEACSTAEMSCVGVASSRSDRQWGGTSEQNLQCEERRA